MHSVTRLDDVAHHHMPVPYIQHQTLTMHSVTHPDGVTHHHRPSSSKIRRTFPLRALASLPPHYATCVLGIGFQGYGARFMNRIVVVLEVKTLPLISECWGLFEASARANQYHDLVQTNNTTSCEPMA
jgi:hypothetical protein